MRPFCVGIDAEIPVFSGTLPACDLCLVHTAASQDCLQFPLLAEMLWMILQRGFAQDVFVRRSCSLPEQPDVGASDAVERVQVFASHNLIMFAKSCIRRFGDEKLDVCQFVWAALVEMLSHLDGLFHRFSLCVSCCFILYSYMPNTWYAGAAINHFAALFCAEDDDAVRLVAEHLMDVDYSDAAIVCRLLSVMLWHVTG